MTWSFRIGRLFGIDIFVHATFVLLPLWFVGETYYRTGSWAAALDQLLFILLVFAIIVMHEYGHALTARVFGIRTRDIILLPIGGVARLEGMPQKPWQELLIAAAGPAVNVVLAMICFVWFAAEGLWTLAQQGPQPQGQQDAIKAFLESSMSFRLLFINVLLIVFNLIPAFPMDGGRILRAILAMQLDYVKATWIAARIGQAAAILFVVWGLFGGGSPMLLLIAIMVWTGALQEAQFVTVRASLTGRTVRQAMSDNFLTLNPFDTLETASQKLVMTPQLAFPVLHGDNLVGMISRKEVAAALANLGPGRHVSEVMRRESPVARPEDDLLVLLPQLQRGSQSLPVVEGDQLIGLITLHDVAVLASDRPAKT